MTVKELYNQVGGDYDEIMSRFPKEELVVRFLHKYAESDEMAKLEEAVAAKDYTRIFEVSHNLKGMSINIGLNQMNRTIDGLCEATRGGKAAPNVEAMMAQIKAEHEAFLSALEKLD